MFVAPLSHCFLGRLCVFLWHLKNVWLVGFCGWLDSCSTSNQICCFYQFFICCLVVDWPDVLLGWLFCGGLAARVFDSPTSFKEVGMLTCCVFCVLGCARRLASGATIWLLQAGGQTIPSKTQQTGFSHRSAGFVCTLFLFFLSISSHGDLTPDVGRQ